jgi:hypothetical protein
MEHHLSLNTDNLRDIPLTLSTVRRQVNNKVLHRGSKADRSLSLDSILLINNHIRDMLHLHKATLATDIVPKEGVLHPQVVAILHRRVATRHHLKERVLLQGHPKDKSP